MSQPDYLISTPENVDLHLELAGIGNRIFACLVDVTLTLAILLVLWIGCLMITGLIQFAPLSSDVKTWAIYGIFGVAILINLAIIFGYFIFFEGFWMGQSPGKRLVHIRVIEQTGQPASWAGVFIRNLLRVADMGFFLVGLIFMLADQNERRLGDLAAGTLVIRERLPGKPALSLAPGLEGSSPAGSIADVGRLSPTEYDLLLSFLQRRGELTKSARPLLAHKLDDYFRKRLEEPARGESAEFFLEKIYLAYQSRAGQIY